MPVCAVFGCISNSKNNPEYSFHGLPRFPATRRRWLRILGPITSRCPFVCSRHFAAEAYKATKPRCLLPTSEPTLFLPPPIQNPEGELSVVLACRACLATDTRLYEMQEHDLDDIFIDLTRQQFSVMDGLPRHLCAVCCTQLSKFAEFREKCQTARDLLGKLKTITIQAIKAIDRQSNDLSLKLTQTVVHELDTNNPAQFLPEINTDGETVSKINADDSSNEANFDSVIGDDVTNTKNGNKSNKEVISCATSIQKEERKKEVINKVEMSNQSKSGNTRASRKRKILYDDVYPNFDYADFEKRFKVKIDLLSMEQQREDIEMKKRRDSYLKSSHRCEMCGKGFNYEVTLKNHMGYHDPVIGPYECEICHFRFKYNKKRLKHRDQHRLKFICIECGFVSRDRQFARRHYATHQGERYKCPHCPLTYERASSCLNHARTAHPAHGVACPTCGETFLSKLGVRHHVARAHRPHIQPTLKCDICKATFSSSEALEKHSSIVTDETHLTHAPCLICGDLFVNEDELATHTAEQHPPDEFRCEKCDETFLNAASFARHTRRKHLGERVGERRAPRPAPAPRPPRAVCEICGKLMLNQTVLAYHQYIHMSKKPFACPHCDKTFAAKHSREWHIRTHTGEKPYQCEVCPAAFSVPTNLRRHRKVVHLGERRSTPCPLCGKIFSAPSAVKLHVDTVHHHKPAPPRRPRRKQTKTAANV